MTVNELITALLELPPEFSEVNCYLGSGEPIEGVSPIKGTDREGPHLIIWSF